MPTSPPPEPAYGGTSNGSFIGFALVVFVVVTMAVPILLMLERRQDREAREARQWEELRTV